jgi:type 1 fimbriae regulatory protein FimB
MAKAKRQSVGKRKRGLALRATRQSGQSVSAPAPQQFDQGVAPTAGQQSGQSVAPLEAQQSDQGVDPSSSQQSGQTVVPSRDYLTPNEIARMVREPEVFPRVSAWGTWHRDRLIVMMMFRHGLRASEVASLRMDDVNVEAARLVVRHQQRGRTVEHPIPSDEVEAIKAYLVGRLYERERRFWEIGRPQEVESFFFLNRVGRPLTRHGVHRIVKELARRARLSEVGPLTLRRSCGHALAAKGVDLATIQEYLGLCDPRHVRRFAKSAGHRFEGLWDQ